MPQFTPPERSAGLMAARRPRRERHLRPVASLWIGERLRWIDRLALTALRHHGHEVTLYHAGPAPAARCCGGPAPADGHPPDRHAL